MILKHLTKNSVILAKPKCLISGLNLHVGTYRTPGWLYTYNLQCVLDRKRVNHVPQRRKNTNITNSNTCNGILTFLYYYLQNSQQLNVKKKRKRTTTLGHLYSSKTGRYVNSSIWSCKASEAKVASYHIKSLQCEQYVGCLR